MKTVYSLQKKRFPRQNHWPYKFIKDFNNNNYDDDDIAKSFLITLQKKIIVEDYEGLTRHLKIIWTKKKL